tara:strand:- start:317 stop:628 length:312 start_codon:yes stop_codon:yes gene_type:complete
MSGGQRSYQIYDYQLRGSVISDKNSFKEMNFLLFGTVSFVFFATFPLSLVFSLMVLGVEQTKQLLFALLEEFLQTLLIMLCALATLFWAIYSYVWPWFIGLFS